MAVGAASSRGRGLYAINLILHGANRCIVLDIGEPRRESELQHESCLQLWTRSELLVPNR
jgi:hypothetical protein